MRVCLWGNLFSTPTVRSWYRWVTSWWDLPRSAVYRLNLQVFTRLARSYHWCEMLCWPWGSGCRQECVWTSYSDIRLHQSVPQGFKKWLQHECHRSAKFESPIHQHDIEQWNCGKWNVRIQQRHGYHKPPVIHLSHCLRWVWCVLHPWCSCLHLSQPQWVKFVCWIGGKAWRPRAGELNARNWLRKGFPSDEASLA